MRIKYWRTCIMSDKLNVLLIGQCSFKYRGGHRCFFGGTEKMNDVLIRVMQEHCNVFFLFDHGIESSRQDYMQYYNLADTNIIPDSIEDLEKYLIDNHIDIVMISGWLSDTLIKCIKELFSRIDIPIIMYNHGTACCNPDDYMTEDVKTKDNFYIINCTQHEYNHCISHGIPENRLFLIDNPVDIEQEVLDKVGQVSLTDDFVITARMVVEKGIPNTLSICEKLNKKAVIIGNKCRGYVLRDIAARFPGLYEARGILPREQLIDIVLHSQMFGFMPNEPEGMSLCVLEANALGVPAITWDDYSIPNFIDNKYNIFLEHTPDFVDQFMSLYNSRSDFMDFYLDPNNRKDLSNRTMEKYGIKRYGIIINSIIFNCYSSRK